MQSSTAVAPTRASAGYPDAINTRLILRIYAWVSILLGLRVGIRSMPDWVADLRPSTLNDLVSVVLVGAGASATALAVIDDPVVSRRALVRFAIAHLVFGALWLAPWSQMLGGPAFRSVGWAPLICGVVLLYLGLTAPTGMRMRRTVMTYGSFHDRKSSSVDRLRSQYEEQIRLAAQREERTRLARDLHDAVKQQLFVVHTAAATAEARLASDEGATREAIGQIRTAAREATTELQAMIEQLQAAPIENVGLAEALKKQCEALEFRTGAQVRLTIGQLPPSDSMPPGTQAALFRAAQEALANIARHARARRVEVTLGTASRRLELSIRDDGVGFDPATTPPGMGIENMMARAQELGGSFSLESKAGEGTTIEFAVPYSLISAWQYGWPVLVFGAILMTTYVTRRDWFTSPLVILLASLIGINVARNIIALVKLRGRRTGS